MPVLKKKKPKIPKDIREKCLSLKQKIRKIEESHGGYCTCISCGKLIELGSASCQGGHFISRSNRATELESDNIFPQCSVCNVCKRGNYHAYEFNLRQKIGNERVDRLINMAMARDGSDDALSKLTEKDKETALAKRTSTYYLEQYEALKQKLKEITNDNN